MLDFILKNYYVILIICILLIFGIIGYIIDTLKTSKNRNTEEVDTYIPEEEVFIQNTEEEPIKEEVEEETSVDNLIEEYNNEQDEETEEDSN